ncbi:MAG: helix-turn-helix transcriptional regulator [Mycobacteriaceae bacterium]|nr:helix-turn-helix transcriptional regulator [Mycobacteriaceae bacterium]
MEPVDKDSRGILDPWLLQRRVRLTRYPAGPELADVIDRFWAVRWDLPAGMHHRQQVLTHPCANLSVGHGDASAADFDPDLIEARCSGVATSLTARTMAGQGWTVAAMTRPGGLGAFTDAPADLTDRVVALQAAIGGDDTDLAQRIGAAPTEAARIDLLAAALTTALRPDRLDGARHVTATARLMETDRSLRTLTELAERTGSSPRRLQRQFREYAGVSPTWVLRRYRLLEAAESARDGEPVVWADVAADLGYADQAHLIRDFHAATGRTPGAYAADQHP